MNADAQFKDFVSRQQRPAAIDTALDWQQEKQDWLTHLRELYNRIDVYLEHYISDGSIRIHETSIELNEENIGFYQAPRRIMSIGSQDIVFTPIGTLLIGTKGRVDVEGSRGQSRLLLVDQKGTDAYSMIRVDVRVVGDNRMAVPPVEEEIVRETSWAWKIVSAPPAMQFIDLNRDTLFTMLMEVSHG